ncbi:MAG: quinolinate synthase NadA [candidate division WOR-3 bacterium]
MPNEELKEKILRLKEERDAIILAHNYMRPEVQEIADYIGDSLGLSVQARDSDKPVIVFCGVSFMAEVAKLLSPDKTVLHPVPGARCPMADMVSVEDVLSERAEHPSATVLSYVNTNADVKAVSDVICTSRNAVRIAEAIENDEVILLPDENLALYVAGKLSGKRIIPGKGYCYVHAEMTADDVVGSRKAHPDAVVIVHPECPPEVCALADHVASTGEMVELARDLPAGEFIIGTELGMIDRLSRMFPEKRFYTLGPARICHNMKKITLEEVYNSLLHMRYQVVIEPELAERARASVQRMFEIGARK